MPYDEKNTKSYQKSVKQERLDLNVQKFCCLVYLQFYNWHPHFL